jgi:SAM-dependent methyltransferase
MTDVSDPSYWSSLYQTNEAGWDKGRCAPPIARMLREGVLPPAAQIAVIGCGPGHEAFEAARLGFRVTAIDFAPEAITAVRGRAVELGLALEAVQADVFDLAKRWPGKFDAIVEHTCLCAIDPARREEYMQATSGALKPQGVLLGLFYAHNRPDGPPFSIHEHEVRKLLAPYFQIERLVIAVDSFENRAGHELEFIACRD